MRSPRCCLAVALVALAAAGLGGGGCTSDIEETPSAAKPIVERGQDPHPITAGDVVRESRESGMPLELALSHRDLDPLSPLVATFRPRRAPSSASRPVSVELLESTLAAVQRQRVLLQASPPQYHAFRAGNVIGAMEGRRGSPRYVRLQRFAMRLAQECDCIVVWFR